METETQSSDLNTNFLGVEWIQGSDLVLCLAGTDEPHKVRD